MASLGNEIRVLFAGPENRFFVAYKPPGWFLTAPFDRSIGDAVMAPILAAKLGVNARSITFPGKLGVRERGLIIGCTDEGMHRSLSRMLQNGLCTRSYHCIVHANRSRGAREAGFDHLYGCFNHRTDVSAAIVSLDVVEHAKGRTQRSLEGISDPVLRSNLKQFLAKSRSVYASNVTLEMGIRPEEGLQQGQGTGDDATVGHADRDVPGGNDPSTTNSCGRNIRVGRQYRKHRDETEQTKPQGQHRIAVVIENLRHYLNRCDQSASVSGNEASCSRGTTGKLARFRHLELVTSSYLVNRHLLEVLASLGLVVLTGEAQSTSGNINVTGTSLCLELCGLQFSHPIHRDRVIEVKVHENNPEVPRDWVKHAVIASSGPP